MSHNNSTTGTSNYPDIFKTRCSLRSRAQSTPVKKNQHVSSRKQVQLSLSVKETPGDPEFTSKHLSSIPSVIDWKRSIDHDFLAEATKKKPEGGEWRYYHPFASFLTSISRYIFGKTFIIYLSIVLMTLAQTGFLLEQKQRNSWSLSRMETST